MAYTAWRGALEIKVGGFPVPVPVAFQNRVKQLKTPGFKLISPDGDQVGQKYLTADGSWAGTIGECHRGVEVGGEIVPLDPDAVKAISEADRSEMVQPDSFAPLDSLDLSLAIGCYAVVPDTKHAGAEQSCSIVWNGLRYTGMAYITRMVLRSGALDRMIAIYADERGLWAVGLPYATEMDPGTGHSFQADDNVGAMFAQAIEAEYEIKTYDGEEHEPVGFQRREQLLERALAGQVIAAPKIEPKSNVPDLMALLANTATQAKPKAKAAKAKKAKVAA